MFTVGQKVVLIQELFIYQPGAKGTVTRVDGVIVDVDIYLDHTGAPVDPPDPQAPQQGDQYFAPDPSP